MRFDIITLFPELFAPFLASGVTRRAYASGPGRCAPVCGTPGTTPTATHPCRVDDRPFGSGPGMDRWLEPLARCLAAIRAEWVSPRRIRGAGGAFLPHPAGR